MPESCSGQRQMSFVPEQMRPCFVPFLSWPPGWGSGGTLTPKLPCLTSAVAAQGTSLLGRRAAAWAIRALLLCKCQDSLAAVATYVCAAQGTRVCLCDCICLCVFTSLSAFHDCRRWHGSDWKLWHQRWGCKAAGCEEALELLQLSQQAPAALLPICLRASCLQCWELPRTPRLLRKIEKWAEWCQLSQSRRKYQNLYP